MRAELRPLVGLHRNTIKLGIATCVVALLVGLASEARAAAPIKVRSPAPGRVFVAADAGAARALRVPLELSVTRPVSNLSVELNGHPLSLPAAQVGRLRLLLDANAGLERGLQRRLARLRSWSSQGEGDVEHKHRRLILTAFVAGGRVAPRGAAPTGCLAISAGRHAWCPDRSEQGGVFVPVFRLVAVALASASLAAAPAVAADYDLSAPVERERWKQLGRLYGRRII